MSGRHHESISPIPTDHEAEEETAAVPVDLPPMEVEEIPASSHPKDTLIDKDSHPCWWWSGSWRKHRRLICLSVVGLVILSTVVAIVTMVTKQRIGKDHGLSWDGGGTLDRAYVYPHAIPQSPSDTRAYRSLTVTVTATQEETDE